MGKLSASIISKAIAGEVIWDDQVKGLHVRVRKSGAAYFLYFRDKNNIPRRPKIGDHGLLNLSQARLIAREWLIKNVKGETVPPFQEKDPTFFDLHAQWQREHKPNLKPTTQALQEGQWNKYILPELGYDSVAAVGRQKIYDLFKKISDENPVMANRVLSLITIAMDLAERWEMRDPLTNFCKTIKRNKETARKRYLKPEELQRAGAVLASWHKQGSWWRRASQFILLVLITGARKNEIAQARREWVDLAGRALRLPDSKTGEKIIPLPPMAVEIINHIFLEEPNGQWLCRGITEDQPLKDPYHTWNEFLKEAGITDFHIHDMRHTFASVGLSYKGMNLKQIGGVLGHASAQSSNRYSHLMPAQHIELSDSVAGTLRNLLFRAEGFTDTGISSIVS